MAEDKKPSLLDQFLDYSKRAASVYQTVELANHGVAVQPTTQSQTNGSGDPLVAVGKPAGVVATDPLADALNNVTNKAAMAYSAKQLHESMPYILGMTAAVIAIYMLTRK